MMDDGTAASKTPDIILSVVSPGRELAYRLFLTSQTGVKKTAKEAQVDAA